MKQIGYLLFILFIIYFIFMIRQDIIDLRFLQDEKKNIEKSIALEQETLKNLKVMDEEEFARTRLGLIKKGETAYKVVN